MNLAAVGLLELVFRALPPRALVAVTSGIGHLWYYLSADRRRIALENLRLALGDKYTEAERKEIAKASFRHFGIAITDLVLADRLFDSRGGPSRRFRYIGGFDELDKAVRAGNAGMIVGAHLGSWEVAPYAVRNLGIPLQIVVRTLDDPQLDRFVTKRRGGEQMVIRKQGAARGMMRAFRNDTWVGFLADQNAGKHGVFVPFFGIPACTVPAPAALNRRLGIPIFVGLCLARPNTVLRYDMHVERVPDPPPGLSEGDHVRHLMGSVNGFVERWIEAHPEQYNWCHRRWKTRPAGEEPGPRTPAYGKPQLISRPRERVEAISASDGIG